MATGAKTQIGTASSNAGTAAGLPNPPVHARNLFHTSAAMWDAWAAGDRRGALAAIPDSIVDELVVHGSVEQCRGRIQEYFDNGVTTSSLAILPLDPDVPFWDAARALAPGGELKR